MTASGDATLDFSSLGNEYTGRIKYDNTTNSFYLYANASAIATLVLTSATATVVGALTATNIHTKKRLTTC